MKTFPRIPSAKISALISDVDGTLVTDDKILTVRAQAAVAKLHACGINFAIIRADHLAAWVCCSGLWELRRQCVALMAG